MRTAQTEHHVDPSRVGLYGHSQGGWVAPLAASLSRGVAFIVAVSGPGVTPAEQGMYAVGEGMRADGWSEADVDAPMSRHGGDASWHRVLRAGRCADASGGFVLKAGPGAYAAPRGSTALRAVLHSARGLAPLRPVG